MKVSSFVALFIFISSASLASSLSPSTRNTEGWLQAPDVLPAGVIQGVYDEAIDHTGLLPGQTFEQRYWVDSDYATSPSAPVIYHICGEGDVDNAYFLHDNALAWAQALGARVVWLEHRYYGQSQPFSDLSNDHMKYLTLTNVLEDLASFQKWISSTQGWTGKWITVGGSYSGTISALYRFKHPELVAGALASSAPMISGQGQDEGTQDDVNQLNYTDPSANDGGRPWVYESCTEFGFWETDETTLYEPSAWLCQQLFGNGVPLYNATTYNQTEYAPFITNSPASPTNILFTYGSGDIWTTIGIPQTGVQNPGITVHVIEGAGHHFDLNYPDPSDSQAVLDARALFTKLAKGWLGISGI